MYLKAKIITGRFIVIDGWMDGWMMDGWMMDVWMDGWMDG